MLFHISYIFGSLTLTSLVLSQAALRKNPSTTQRWKNFLAKLIPLFQKTMITQSSVSSVCWVLPHVTFPFLHGSQIWQGRAQTSDRTPWQEQSIMNGGLIRQLNWSVVGSKLSLKGPGAIRSSCALTTITLTTVRAHTMFSTSRTTTPLP